MRGKVVQPLRRGSLGGYFRKLTQWRALDTVVGNFP